MDRNDELDRSHGDDDPTHTWSTSSQFGFPDYYGYSSNEFGMPHRDAAVHPAAARDLRTRRGLVDTSQHQAVYAASMPASFHETWPTDAGMMAPESQHMLLGQGGFHAMQASQHPIQATSIPFPSHPVARPSVPSIPGVSSEEAERTLQALLTAAGLNGAVLPGQSQMPGRPASFEPSQQFFPSDPRQDQFPPSGQGMFPHQVPEQHSRSVEALQYMMHPSHPHPTSTSAARPSSNVMWAHTYPGSARPPGSFPHPDMGLENPFPAHIDSTAFRPAHTLPFPSPPASPTIAQRSSPPVSAASAPAVAGSHINTNAGPDAPGTCKAPDLPALSASMGMFPMRQLPDRSGKPDLRTSSAAAMPISTGNWVTPATDAAGAALPYDCLSLPTIHESSQPRRGSFSGPSPGGLAPRGAQLGQASSGGFGSPPPRALRQLSNHDSMRSNNSGSFRSTSSVNTSFHGGFGSFHSESFHNEGEGAGEHTRSRGQDMAAAAAAAAAAVAPPPPPQPTSARGSAAAGAGDEMPQDTPAPATAATDMSRCARRRVSHLPSWVCT